MLTRRKPADPKAQPYHQLATAIKKHDVQGIERAFEAGAEPDGLRNSSSHERPLMLALMEGDIPTVLAVLDAGADQNLSGYTVPYCPLAYAAMKQNIPAACLLLAAGASPDNPLPNNGRSPFYYAISKNNQTLFDLLCDAGADPTKRDSRKENALNHAQLLNKTMLRDRLTGWKRPPHRSGKEWWEARLAGIAKEDFFAGKGDMFGDKTYLHHRDSWGYLQSHIVPGLAVGGNPLHKSDMLAPRELNGKTQSFAELGVRMFKLPELMKALERVDEPLTGEDLIGPNGVTELGQALIDTWQFRKLYTVEAWQDRPIRDLKRFHDALSEEQQSLVPYHQISANVRRLQRQEARSV